MRMRHQHGGIQAVIAPGIIMASFNGLCLPGGGINRQSVGSGRQAGRHETSDMNDNGSALNNGG